MNQLEIFQDRIKYKGELKPFFIQVCKDYNIGEYRSHQVVPIGYEDFNVVLKTTNGKYFAKIFAAFRDEQLCRRYVEITTRALEVGVSHPRLFQSPQGYLHETSIDGVPIRMCLMEFMGGKSFYELNTKPVLEEMRFLAQQASLINSISYKPEPYFYDIWAIVHFLEEYEQKKQYLKQEDDKFLAPLAEKFSQMPISDLPHCFVHGDIIKTNVMRCPNNKIYIYDFSVANWYPRIQELAVLLCNLLFDENHPETFPEYYQLAVNEYQKRIPLTTNEINYLPLYVQGAHAMHVLLTSYERSVNGNTTAENEYYYELGKVGLKYTRELWKDWSLK